MQFDTFNYNATVKKVVAVFGTIFNNVTIGRVNMEDGTLSNVQRVPIAYGPKEKFLARVDEQASLADPKLAIKLPRMSFEITSLAYDSSIKLSRYNRTMIPDDGGDVTKAKKVSQSVPYKLGMQLNILARNQDDALQILEQIIPTFQPEYTVSVIDMDGPGTSADVPFTLTAISMVDVYEGDMAARSSLVYTLDFETKIRFTAPPLTTGIIRYADADIFLDGNATRTERIEVTPVSTVNGVITRTSTVISS